VNGSIALSKLSGVTHGQGARRLVKRWTNPLNLIIMLRWVLTFLVIALIAGVLGFTGIAAGAAEIAKVIFYIFLVLLVLSLLFGGMIWKKVS